MFKTVAVTLSGALIAVAAPAFADATKTADPSPTGASATAPQTVPVATKVVRATRYCVVTVPTGSILQTRTCRTRAEWMADGFDPTAK